MRVALSIHALYGGGAERLMSELANRWADKHEIHLITWTEAQTDQYQLSANIERHGLSLMQPSANIIQGIRANLRRVRALRRTLLQIEPEFILSFSDQMNIVTLQAARGLQVPTWISEHSDPRKQHLGFLWETWRKMIYPNCDGCVVLTNDIADYMCQLIPRRKIRVIPPAIGAKAISQVAQAPHDLRSLLFVGRLSREKRVDLLLKAWREIAPQLPDWQLRLVGEGSERAKLETLAEGLSSIKFLGWSQDPREHYCSADMFVLSSEYEGFPVALLEALNSGLACVSTQCSTALKELNSPDECVVSVPVNSQSALASAILDLAGDTRKREQLGRLGRKSAQRFHWNSIGPLWDALLEQ